MGLMIGMNDRLRSGVLTSWIAWKVTANGDVEIACFGFS